ncbi:MAG: class I SAM-dependent methyltransferase [Deltaproteobacteria bacterium]|nr:class I SAM-dependent methyltransferase [Deltaproteobacteria bacterium]
MNTQDTDDFERIRRQKFHLPDQALEDAAFQEVLSHCRPFTLTSEDRMYALHTAVRYIIRAHIVGDMVECGVWKGGSCMNIALTSLQQGAKDRTIYLFDTYEGMTPPEKTDVDLLGRPASQLLTSPTEAEPTKCLASLAEVQKNMCSTGYPPEKIQCVKGPVERTLPAYAPQHIALLRLDTDWYASTKHELEQLYPRLAAGGVLIIDDYGHWRGAQKATDDFFAHCRPAVFMQRIDYSGRLIIKR